MRAIEEILLSHGITSTTIADLPALQVAYCTTLAMTWEFTYSKFLLNRDKRAETDKSADYKMLRTLEVEVLDEAQAIYKVIFAIRSAYYERISGSRELMLQERDRCESDIRHFLNLWGYVQEPRNTQLRGSSGKPLPSHLPFIPYPAQWEVIQIIESSYLDRLELVVGKSREMGVSWAAMAVCLHKWLFESGFRAILGSEKMDKVDLVGSSNPLMGKFRYMLYNLPAFLRPEAMIDKGNSHDSYGKIINPENGAEILGESGDNIGRSGRCSMAVMDEAQDLSQPDIIESALESTTEVKIWIGTPKGMNHFGQKFHSPSCRSISLMWYQDPRKNEQWEKDEPNPDSWWRMLTELRHSDNKAKLAQEHDLSWTASVDGICIPQEWVLSAINFPLPQQSIRNKVTGFDLAGSGSDSGVVISRTGNMVLLDDIVTIDEKIPARSIWMAHEEVVRKGSRQLNYDSVAIGDSVWGQLMDSDRDIPYDLRPIHGSASAGEDIPRGESEPANRLYGNIRSRIWNNLRRLFYNTFQQVNGLANFSAEELISIPNHKELVEQLSYPKRMQKSGKWWIEGKSDMKKRRLKSPDHADALAYSFTDVGIGESLDEGEEREPLFSSATIGGNVTRDVPLPSQEGWDYEGVVVTCKSMVSFTIVRASSGLEPVRQVVARYETEVFDSDTIKRWIRRYVPEYKLESLKWWGHADLLDYKDSESTILNKALRAGGVRLRGVMTHTPVAQLSRIVHEFRSKRMWVCVNVSQTIAELQRYEYSGGRHDTGHTGIIALIVYFENHKPPRKVAVEQGKRKLDYSRSSEKGNEFIRAMNGA